MKLHPSVVGTLTHLKVSNQTNKIHNFLTIFGKTGHDRCWMLVAIASFREVRMIYSCIQLKTANLKNGKWFSKGTHSHTCKAGQPQNHTTKLRPKLTIAEYMSHKIWPPPFKLHFFPDFQFQAWRNHDSRSKAYDILFEKETRVKGVVVSAVIILL